MTKLPERIEREKPSAECLHATFLEGIEDMEEGQEDGMTSLYVEGLERLLDHGFKNTHIQGVLRLRSLQPALKANRRVPHYPIFFALRAQQEN